MIARAAHEIVEAGAFAAEDDDEIAGEIEFVVRSGAAFVEPDDPKVATLEFFEGANEVDDAGDAEVLGGARTGFDGCGAKRSGAALGEENAVEREDEASGGVACGGKGREEVLEGEKFLRADERDDALVSGGFGGDGELLTRPLKDADACVAALGDEVADARIAAVVRALASDENVIEAAATGLESFRDRVQSVKNFHGDSLVVGRAMTTAWRWLVD